MKQALARFHIISRANTFDAHSYWHVCLKGDKQLKNSCRVGSVGFLHQLSPFQVMASLKVK